MALRKKKKKHGGRPCIKRSIRETEFYLNSVRKKGGNGQKGTISIYSSIDVCVGGGVSFRTPFFCLSDTHLYFFADFGNVPTDTGAHKSCVKSKKKKTFSYRLPVQSHIPTLYVFENVCL